MLSSSVGYEEPKYVTDLSRIAEFGEYRSSRLLFLTCLFSLAGVPPAVGFIAKLSVLSVLAQYSFGFVFLIFVVFTMIVSAVGYLRLISAVIFYEAPIGNKGLLYVIGGVNSTVVFNSFAIIIMFAGLFVL